MNKKKAVLITVPVVLIMSFCVFCCSLKLETTFYKVESDLINSRVRIVQLSDLHSSLYGENQSTLMGEINTLSPDIVVLTGDMYDYEDPPENTVKLIEQISHKYRVYFVTGNHEYRRGEADEIKQAVRELGITVLDGKCETVEINGNTVNICGVDDYDSDRYLKKDGYFSGQIERVKAASDNGFYSILLCHQPHITEWHSKSGADLVLSGHEHGGQWRLPGVQNGLFAPDEGLFPKYSAGRFDFEDHTLIVSRGLAKSVTLIPRIFNRPEIVVIDIE